MRLGEEILNKEERPNVSVVSNLLLRIKRISFYFPSSFLPALLPSESLSAAVVTTLFSASIKVIYKLGQKEMSIAD